MIMSLTTKTNYKKGVKTEDKCRNFLERKGFEVLATRFKTKEGEVDIVAKIDEFLVFIEVKGRKSIEEALYSITDRQRARIINTAKVFLSENEEYNQYSARFDVMACSDNEIYHLENCWGEEEGS